MRVALLVGIAGLCWAQTAFEVASLKPAAPNNMGDGFSLSVFPGGRLRGANMSLRQMIQIAWDLKQKNLVTGDGNWLDSQKYDLDAKVSGALGEPEARVMMQTLLLERFNLKYHRETRQLPVYFLELAKSGVTGPDLHEAPSGDCGKMPNAQAVPPPTPGAPGANPCGGIGISSGRFNGHRTNMEELATDLSLMLGRPVFDKTSLPGSFDLTLTWTPDQIGGDSPGPSIYTALQEQLGLKVETGRGPVEMIVVDSAEKPTGN
jgi:uncharacterized protein (TIGR03435 family)